jgi:membrane protein DedA with SNARE-associated domain
MLNWWSQAREAVQALFEEYGLQAAFVLFLIDELGILMPVPGYVWPILVGIQASTGRIPLWQAILAMEVAATLGASALYAVSALAGRPLVYRFASFVRLSPATLEQAEAWLRRRGVLGVILGRLIPGLRVATAIACGVFSVPARVALPGLSAGSFVYVAVYTMLGYLVGPPVLASLERYQAVVGPTAWLGALAALLALLVRTRRSHRSP